jgi:hypothetical protein
MAYETLLLSDKATLVLERVDGGKIRSTSESLEHAVVIFEHEVLEARIKSGRPRIARKDKDFDEHPEGRWRKFTYDELTARDKTSLDVFWLKDKSLTDLDDCQSQMTLRRRSSRTSKRG